MAVNPARFTVHAAIHDGIPGAHCVMHTHTTAGMVVACSIHGLSMSNFYSAQLHDKVPCSGREVFDGPTRVIDRADTSCRT